jgi:hypothetical protein
LHQACGEPPCLSSGAEPTDGEELPQPCPLSPESSHG